MEGSIIPKMTRGFMKYQDREWKKQQAAAAILWKEVWESGYAYGTKGQMRHLRGPLSGLGDITECGVEFMRAWEGYIVNKGLGRDGDCQKCIDARFRRESHKEINES